MDEIKNYEYALSYKIDEQQELFFLANCPLHAEDLLSQEIVDLGGTIVERVRSGVYFCGKIDLLYRSCLWLRTASSLKLVIKRFKAKDRPSFYQAILTNPWFDHMTSATSIACQVSSAPQSFAPNHFLALVVKDAIADSFRKVGRARPNVNTENPDLGVAVHMEGENGTLLLELGHALHQRSWRINAQSSEHGVVIKKKSSSMQENLAAVLLYRSHWPKFARQGLAFVDAICWQGVTLFEAYAMATDYAPQLKKSSIGFEKWVQYDPALWQKCKEEANLRYEKGKENTPLFYGFDTNDTALDQARLCCEKAQFSHEIQFEKSHLLSLRPPCEKGFMIINPKYSEQLNDAQKTEAFFHEVATYMKANLRGWNIAMTLPSEDALRYLDVRTDRLNTFYHGAEKRHLARFTLFSEAMITPLSKQGERMKLYLQDRYASLSDLAKKKWKTSVYRLYCAEKPGYAALCDIYNDILVIQPFETSPEIKELTRACQEVAGINRVNTVIKKRRKMKESEQYETEKSLVNVEKIVIEGGLKFYVNLSAYIDTGFYLDHRPLRLWLSKECKGNTFLNLFCYTGAMSVVAAQAGARKICSVDASKTYLNIAEKNMKLNRLETLNAQWVRSDVHKFLQKNSDSWDIIYVDPPTYSNGTGRDNFDVHRDHPRLLHLCIQALAPKGKIYFSTHSRKFRLDEKIECDYLVKDLTKASLDEDCQTDRPIHYLWEIKKRK
ncbi:MAG: bifunctional 23S rRNA (guanine(2069)-N(7))-methyltransferase RlmK/23S rRNA (guanine(2445)-N(2))-methyltransferase RlmL [Spirochaetia bacterium]